MLSCRAAFVVMMESPHLGYCDDLTEGRRVNWPWLWAVHGQRQMGTETVVILKVAGQNAPQMQLVQHDHVVQAFTADTPNEPSDIGVLPRTPGSDDDFFDPHMPHPLPKRGAIDAVPITHADIAALRPMGRLPSPAEPSTAPWGVP